MSRRISAVLFASSGKQHLVELQVRAETGRVRVEVLRPRRDAKSDQDLALSPDAARELMRALQAGADEAARRQYQEAKRQRPSDLEAAVERVAAALEAEERE